MVVVVEVVEVVVVTNASKSNSETRPRCVAFSHVALCGSVGSPVPKQPKMNQLFAYLVSFAQFFHCACHGSSPQPG